MGLEVVWKREVGQMKRIGQIIMSVVLLSVMLLTACGKEEEEAGGKKEYLSSSYVAVEADEQVAAGLSGDRLYYVQPASDGYMLYASDVDTRKQEKIYEESDGSNPPHVTMLAAAADGRIALLKYKDSQASESMSGREYRVAVLTPEGTVRAEYDVTACLGAEGRPDNMLLDGQGNVYLVFAGGEGRILALDPEGQLQHTFTPEGTVKGVFMDGEGRVYCACASREAAGEKLLLMELQLAGKSIKEVCRLTADRTGSVFFAESPEGVLFSEGEVLYQLDLKSGEKTELLRWMDVDIDSGSIRNIVLRENGDIGVSTYYVNTNIAKLCYEVTLLRDAERGAFQTDSGSAGAADASGAPSGEAPDQAEEQVVLTYATMNMDGMLRSWIVDFNKEHPECRIEVKEYGGEGYEAGMLRLNADIVAGNVPDIMDLDDVDVGAYLSKGILADLYPFLDADAEMGREEFIPGILKQYDEDGKLYGIMAGFYMETMMGKESVVGTASDWTIERMQEVLAQVPEGGVFIENLAPIGLLRVLLHKGMGEFLDWENGTCSFDSEEFIQLLELANSMDAKYLDGEREANLASGMITVDRLYLKEVSDYMSSAAMFKGEKASCVGFPSAQGGAGLVYPYLPMGISGLSEHQDLAWEFVRSFLTDDFQSKNVRFNFPIRLSALQKKFDQAVELAAKNEQAAAITQEDLDAVYEAINVPDGKMTYDRNVWAIITEEAEYYFDGQKSAEDVAETIQNRVGIYVGENYK